MSKRREKKIDFHTVEYGGTFLISEDDWRAINETLYLLSIPGMRKSIIKGLKTPIKECDKELKW